MIQTLRKTLQPLANAAHTVLRDLSNRKSEEELAAQLVGVPISNPQPTVVKRLLLDGHFHNPGYWYRLQLLRSALGTHGGDEAAFIWKYNQAQCSTTLRRLGISKITPLDRSGQRTLQNDAKRFAGMVRQADDVLELQLPHDVPSCFLYDAILKRQRTATVNGDDPQIEHDIYEFLMSISAAEALIETHDPDLIAMSHVINNQCTPMAWLGARRGIPVVTLFGNYGVPRFWRMDRPDDIYQSVDCPQRHDLDRLPAAQADALADIGRRYLALRLSGKSNDIGGRMAFSGSVSSGHRSLVADGRPVVAVYASNWFDFPHGLGMNRFRDFLDWIESTLQVALANSSVRWLFRAHPCDKWYGGMTLKDVMPVHLPEHITVAPDDWAGSLVMDIADAVVTYHGTASIEYAAQGKPALVPDRGWYHDCGFAVYPDSREHYLELLGSDWFNGVDVQSAKRRAEIFAGWYFCVPEWQAAAIMPDDSDRKQLRRRMIHLIGEHEPCVRREVEMIKAWMESGEHGYHTFKMKRASSYSLSNVSV